MSAQSPVKSIRSQVFVHDFRTLPTLDLGTHVRLSFTSPPQVFDIEFIGVVAHTVYWLKVLNPERIGYHAEGDSPVGNLMRDLVLALNLALSKCCVSTSRVELLKPEVETSPSPPPPGATVTRDAAGEMILGSGELVIVGAELYAVLSYEEQLDEARVISALDDLRKVGRWDASPSDLRIRNLAKALNDFERAMSATDKATAYQMIFASLEMSVNFDGVSRKGADFDEEASQLTGLPRSRVEGMRRRYNRMKHPDETGADVQLSRADIPAEDMLELRKSCPVALLSRLRVVQ